MSCPTKQQSLDLECLEDTVPPKRQKLSRKCLLCPNTKSESLSQAGEQGKETLKRRAKLQHDYRVLTDIDKLPSVFYHRSCYNTYNTLKPNAHVANGLGILSADNTHVSKVLTRSNAGVEIDWDRCFFCQKVKRETYRRTSSDSIQGGILAQAKTWADFKMIALLETENLYARRALYHGTCFTGYKLRNPNIPTKPITTETNLKTTGSEATSMSEISDTIEIAFSRLVDEITEPLHTGVAFTMKELLNKMQIHEKESSDFSYTTQKLQRKLSRYFGDKVFIHTQHGQGKSNIVMSSALSLSDALKACSEIDSSFVSDDLLNRTNEPINYKSTRSQESIIHEAIGILRMEVEEMPQTKEYYSVVDTSLSFANEYVPPLLKRAMVWLLSKESFNKVHFDETKCSTQVERRALNIAQTVIYCSRQKVISPFHQGISTELYHAYGKKDLINTLSTHGFSMNYDELRQFVTAVGKKELDQIQSGTYVPHGIVHRDDGGQLIQEGDDNIDINCKTVDGKNTLHSMARVVFQEQNLNNLMKSNVHLPVQSDTTLKLNERSNNILKETLHIVIPSPRPLPSRRRENIAKLLNMSKATGVDDRDMLWVMLRMAARFSLPEKTHTHTDTARVFVPSWTGFNASLCESQAKLTVASYPPIIDAKPSDPSTIYTTMSRCRDMTKRLGQHHSIQTMDQQLYCVAQQVKWTKPDEFSDHIIRLGGFHSACSFIASIGKIWGDAGLKDWLVESDVYAGNVVDMMLAGKQFHRSVRGLTLVYEVLLQAQLSAFFDWCEEKGNDIVEFINILNESVTASSDTEVINELTARVHGHISALFKTFCTEMSSSSRTFKFWTLYIEAVQTLLLSIRAEREGDWELHLQCHAQMLPYLFVTNHYNYSRWLPVYLLDMFELPQDVLTKFAEGQFSIKRSAAAFNGVWSDMGTESTVIRDAKGDSGIIGLTSNKSALLRWTLTRNALGEYARSMKERYRLKRTNIENCHEQTTQSVMKMDEKHANALIKYLDEFMSNPFDNDVCNGSNLINIASGVVAPTDISDSLSSLLNEGYRMCKEFVDNTLHVNGNGNFYASISRSKLKTFTDLHKPVKVNLGGKKKITKMNAESVFRRALAISKVRKDLCMASVLKYPLVDTPPSLFNEDGTMRKTTKSHLVNCLEGVLPGQCSRPVTGVSNQSLLGGVSNVVFIRDAMAELHRVSPSCKTFEDVAKQYTANLLKCFVHADVIVDVFDQYNYQNSTKSAERKRRQQAVTGAREYQIIPSRKLPEWETLMALGKNKKSLSNYICEYICEHAPSCGELDNANRKLCLAGGFSDGSVTVCITKDGHIPIESMKSTHEEADSRMMFHAVEANKVFESTMTGGRIIIKSADTDVLVLAVHIYPMLEYTHELWLYTGKATKTNDYRRLIPAHEISCLIGDTLRQSLPSIHALTGCDTTSSFSGIGKKTVWKVVERMSQEDKLPVLDLGQSVSKDSCVRETRNFVVSLYKRGNNTRRYIDLNCLRAELVKSNSAYNKLPPSEDSFAQHVYRAMLQCRIWKSAVEPNPPDICPNDYGWYKEDDIWLPVMYTGQTASEMLTRLLCTCSGRTQCSVNCSCNEAGLECTCS